MDVLRTSPIVPTASAIPEQSAAVTLAAINRLLEWYLHLLGEHQKHQELIKKQFSAVL